MPFVVTEANATSSKAIDSDKSDLDYVLNPDLNSSDDSSEEGKCHFSLDPLSKARTRPLTPQSISAMSLPRKRL